MWEALTFSVSVIVLLILAKRAILVQVNSTYSPLKQQRFLETPKNQTALVGDRIKLVCIVEFLSGEVQWTRNGVGLGTNTSLSGFERYSMQAGASANAKADYSLEIYPVTLEDDASFQCVVKPGNDGQHKNSRQKELMSPIAILLVEFPVMAPLIINHRNESILKTIDGKQETIECVSRRSKPPVQVTWIYDNNQTLESEMYSVKYFKEPIDENSKVFDVHSTLRFVSSKKYHHNKTLKCEARNKASIKTLSTFIRVEVNYAPKVVINLIPNIIREFQHVTVYCTVVEANPRKILNFKWSIIFSNMSVLSKNRGPALVIANISRMYHNAHVKCEAKNAVGWSQSTKKLSILYGPKFSNWNNDIQGDLNNLVTLNCDVSGNPEPLLLWLATPLRQVVGYGASYSIKLTTKTEGKYICQAYVIGFPPVYAETTVSIKAPPKIINYTVKFEKNKKSQNTLFIECVAKSVPLPVEISWFYLGKHISTNDTKYTNFEQFIDNGKRSVLLVNLSAQTSAGAFFKCNAINSYGSSTLEIYLVNKKPQQIVLILASVTGIFLCVLGIFVVKFFLNANDCR